MRSKIFRFSLGIVLLALCQQGIAQVGYTPEQLQKMEATKWEQSKTMKGGNMQKSARPEQDCDNAILVCQSVYVQSQPYLGIGTKNEIDGNISCLGAGEANSVWYKFTANTTGNLNFTITPADLSNDYDWAVYNLTHASCDEIFSSAILQAGCNFSPIPGTTGPNGGVGPQYTSAIPVTAGDNFVIVVSYFTAGNAGFTMDFSASTADIYNAVPPVVTASSYVCDNYGVLLTTDKLLSCSTIASDGTDFAATDALGNTIPVIGAIGLGCAAGEIYTNQIEVMLEGQSEAMDVTISIQQGSDGNTIGGSCLHWMQANATTTTVQLKPYLNAGDDHNTCVYWPYFPQSDAGSGWSTYQWYLNGQAINGETAQLFTPSSAGTYSVSAMRVQGGVSCNYSDTMVVNVDIPYCDNTLPGAFTPNGDGVNDVYLKGNSITIVNRWGQTLFEGSQGWDGTYAGSPVENGTYYVVFKFVDTAGKEQLIKEPVTLMR